MKIFRQILLHLIIALIIRKISIKLVILSVCIASLYAFSVTEWTLYKEKYNKYYANNVEDNAHYQTYLENNNHIKSHKAMHEKGFVSYYKGINQYTDMTYEQIKSVAFGFKVGTHFNTSGNARLHSPKTNSVPMAIDWRTKGAVTAVKNQGSCGSRWAFSAVGTLDSQHQISTGKLVSLSEQNLVDCATAMGTKGCNGGWPPAAYVYIIRISHGIDAETSYPYAGVQQTCAFNVSTVGANANAFAVLTPGDEKVLQEAVANVGPISVCINSNKNFKEYGGGIYDDATCSSNFNNINHCLVVVGYGTDTASGKDYWIVKNSWGMTWGDKGYIKMVRNKQNQCAISTLASYPTVNPTIYAHKSAIKLKHIIEYNAVLINYYSRYIV